MKKLLPLFFIVSSFLLFSCSSDYGSKNKSKNTMENKGFGGAKTDPSHGTVVSDDSVAPGDDNIGPDPDSATDNETTAGNTDREEGTTTGTTVRATQGNTTSGVPGNTTSKP